MGLVQKTRNLFHEAHQEAELAHLRAKDHGLLIEDCTY